MSPIARRVTVHGNVQGVFFRDSTRTAARERGVAGWVRNTSEGTVEAHVEGEPDAVEALVAFMRDGPPDASVRRVDVEEAEVEGAQGFDVA